MVNREEVLANVELHDPRAASQESLGSIEGPMRALADPAGIGVLNQTSLDDRINFGKDRMMHDTVPIRCRPDLSVDRVPNLEHPVPGKTKAVCGQLGFECEEFALELMLERGRAGRATFPAARQSARMEEGVEPAQTLVGSSEATSHESTRQMSSAAAAHR